MEPVLRRELRDLGQGVLGHYEQAVALRQLGVAEKLLEALEVLTESSSDCEEFLQRAYLRISQE